ncbi:MAG: hypothetical protein BroJett018_05040 [Chloroflexota bacterium]|nr:hypothetical protein [Chloroflexota bacterium]NOG63579.1 hypothetical protein [Chloroflexota bacterium]GIK62710.1 MAG: hypothetical protein BroJett018_05040 [Chloroflexota bacterium]
MTLPFELTTMPEQALDILRYMGRIQVDNIHADALMNGLGMSERSFSKGIKRLVTKSYMAMDEARYYRVTQKGYQAIEDINAYDATAPADAGKHYAVLAYDLCAVVPLPRAINQSARWLLGLEPDPMEMETISEPTPILLRVSANGGEVSPAELTLTLTPETPSQFAELNLTAYQTPMRLRVEVFQLMEMNEPYVSGGMYFDVEVSASSQQRALHTTISVAQI